MEMMVSTATVPAGYAHADRAEIPRVGGLKHLALCLVWATFATSGFVFSEPAPVDALMLMLVFLLPLAGLVTLTPALTVYLSLWLIAAAAGLIAATTSLDLTRSLTHTGVTIYLYVASFVIAAFIASRPKAHTELVLGASFWAALAAAAAGIAGYFGLLPGADELFTRFGRASGTFKDPNVFGPFLVPAFLYALHMALGGKISRALLPLSAAGLLALAVFLSFSRGAWMNLAVSVVVYGYLAFVTARSEHQRHKIIALVVVSAVMIAAVGVVALQVDKVADLLNERASFTQSYDVGHEGRFGGQAKALDLILGNPLGIGALQFSPRFHHEEVHNVYLSIVLNSGWLGGGLYWIMVGLTLVLGGRHLLRASATQPLFLIAYAAFLANALEGAIIDSDHWRHFYLLMAIIWGLMSVKPERQRARVVNGR